MASKVRLNKTEQRIIDWMRDGDKALYRNPHNHDRYGYGLSTCFTNLCSRKVVDGLIAKGLIEWFACYPLELRAMLVENNPDHQRSDAYGD